MMTVFRPIGDTVTYSPNNNSTSEASVGLPADGRNRALIANGSDTIAFVKFGITGMGAADSGDIPIAPASYLIVDVPEKQTFARVYSTGNISIYITPGRA